MVRDEMGNPLTVTNADIILTTLEGVQIKGKVTPSLRPGTNYRLLIEMDAGLTTDPYHAAALLAHAPFRLKVKIRETTYLPIENGGRLQTAG